MKRKYIIIIYIVVISFLMPTNIANGSQTNIDGNNHIDPGLYFITGTHGALSGNIKGLNIYGRYNIDMLYLPEPYPYKKPITSYIWDIQIDEDGFYEITPLNHKELRLSYHLLEAFLEKSNGNDSERWIIKRNTSEKQYVYYTISPKLNPKYQMGIDDINDNDLTEDTPTSPIVNDLRNDNFNRSKWNIININTISTPQKLSISTKSINEGVIISFSTQDGSEIFYTDDGSNPVFNSLRKKYTEPIKLNLAKKSDKSLIIQAFCQNSDYLGKFSNYDFDDFIMNLNCSIGNKYKNYLPICLIMKTDSLEYCKMNINKNQEYINKENLSFEVSPYIDKSLLEPMIPIRSISEAVNSTIIWNSNSKICTLINQEGDIAEISSNMKSQNSYVGTIINNRLLISLDMIKQIFSARINWNQKSNEIVIEI